MKEQDRDEIVQTILFDILAEQKKANDLRRLLIQAMTMSGNISAEDVMLLEEKLKEVEEKYAARQH